MVLQFARKGNTWSLPYPEKGKCGKQYRHESWKYHHVKDFFYALIWLKILITFRERCDYLAGISGSRGRIAFTLCWSPSCSPSCFQGLCLEGCKIIKGKQNSKLWFWTKFQLSYTNDRYHCHCWYEYYYYYYYFDDRYHYLHILLRKTGPLWLKKTRTTS